MKPLIEEIEEQFVEYWKGIPEGTEESRKIAGAQLFIRTAVTRAIEGYENCMCMELNSEQIEDLNRDVHDWGAELGFDSFLKTIQSHARRRILGDTK